MLKKATALLLAGLSAATWTGCGTTSSHYVFVTLPSANEIAVYREDPNSGILTVLLNSPFAAGKAPEAALLHPSGKYLYVANSGEDDISLFSIAPSTGIPTEVSRTSTGGLTPLYMALDAAGGFLYVVNVLSAPSSDLSVFKVASDGTLTPTSSRPYPLGVTANSMALAPSGNFIFIGAGQGQQGTEQGIVAVYPLSGGVPQAPVGAFITASNTVPTGLTVDSKGAFLYAANGLSANSISEFSIGSGGVLTQLPGSPLGEPSGITSPVSLIIDPSGKYLYIANQGTNNLGAYSVGTDGGLTILTLSPFSTVKQPTALAADPNGKYLLVGGQSGSLEVFLLNTGNGTLGEVATYSPGGFPSSIAVLR